MENTVIESKQANEVTEAEDKMFSSSILAVICRTAKKLKNSRLSKKALAGVEHDSKTIAAYLGTTEMQAILFTAVFYINYMTDDNANSGAVATYFSFEKIDLLPYGKDLCVLGEKEILHIDDSERKSYAPMMVNISYTVSEEISKAIFNNTKPKIQINTEMNLLDFLSYVGKIFNKNYPAENSEFAYWTSYDKIEKCEQKISNDETIKKIKALVPDNDARYLFYDFCYDRVCDGMCDKSGLKQTLHDFYMNCTRRFFAVARQFMNKEHPLQKIGLVEVEGAETFDDASVNVTEEGLELIVGENIDLYKKKLSDKNLIFPEKIAEKKLFYSDETTAQLSMLRSSLSEETFVSLRSRLAEQHLSQGICVLLYGEPGTGKTESVLQIAKATSRKLYHVDISQTKSCWFGESEKKIKEVFTTYRDMCKTCEKLHEPLPILLFNEADAVFGKRKESTESNVAQTENAIQNIILEEMETLSGILIATTNLADNLDAAFERRFLFKVHFDKPTMTARTNIWQSKIISLSEDNAKILAEEFQFTGGEIDNVVRKMTIEHVIRGIQPSLADIQKLCRIEKLDKGEQRIGFRE